MVLVEGGQRIRGYQGQEVARGYITGRVKGLALDHDHTTGKFRGWLCDRCNLAIGLLGDTLRRVNRAVNYLKRNL